MKRYCSHCGSEVNENAVVCINCGCAIPKGQVFVYEQNLTSKADKKTSVSLILGIVGIVFAWLFALVGHILSIIGIVMGIKEYKETEKLTGLTLSIVGEVCSIISSIIGAVAVSAGF